jgi:hypothetical protein
MKRCYLPLLVRAFAIFCIATVLAANAQAPITNQLPGRVLVKLLPDYTRPKVYALNQAGGALPGTLLALAQTNGAILAEISLSLDPSDMAITPTGDTMYVINTGSRTISKVDLASFSVVAEKTIATPLAYNSSNPLHIVAGPSERIYYTDGAWGPQIYSFDFQAGTAQLVLDTGGNQAHGAGGILLNRTGENLFAWRQYGWSAGSGNSWVTRFEASGHSSLVALEDSFVSNRRDPFDTPLFLDVAERWVFNKQQMFLANDVSVLVNEFANHVYAISLDGSVAFGPTEVFNTANGTTITNLPFSSTVQVVSADQRKLFRYHAAANSLVIFDMATLAPVSGPDVVPTPADGAVVSLPLTNLSWTASPIGLGYDVYFGTNQAQVAAATTASPQYLGRRPAPPQPLATNLAAGADYFWRVDVAGFNVTNAGPVWSFSTSLLSVNLASVTASSIAGYNPASVTLELSGDIPWTASVADSDWLVLSAESGIAPGTLTVRFQTASLPPGLHTNSIAFHSGGQSLQVPVSMTVRSLNLTKMTADRNRPYIYALQPPPLVGQQGLLVFINIETGNIDEALPIGTNPMDLSINDAEGRLYIASWQETWTYVVDLDTQTLLPSLNLGTDVFKINAGRMGRLVTEGQDQWVYITLFNTPSGASLATGLVREGDGEFDRTGRYYYHVDNNSSGAVISKYDTIADSFELIASNGDRGSYYGSRNLVMSADGSRLFWTRMIFDANLVSYDLLPNEVYSCSTNGRIAFGETDAYDTITRQRIHTLPASSRVSAVDAQNQRYWYFAGGQLDSLALSMVEAPKITEEPAAMTAAQAGSPVYLTATAIGLAPLTFQWQRNGANLVGATNYFLSLPILEAGQDGEYQLVVSNQSGSVTSAIAQVTVLTAPVIVMDPASTNVFAGQPFSLSVTAAGSTPLSYRWLLDDITVSGATGPVLTVSNAQAASQGFYQVIVTNSVGSSTSAPAMVRVFPAAPSILSQPVSLDTYASSNATFTVLATGSQPLAYQWFFKGGALAGRTAASLSLTDVQASNAGEYHVVVSNAMGRATSAVATLTVRPLAPYFTVQPSSASLGAGSDCTLTGQANGSQPISYQWQRNGANIPGATSASLLFASVTLNDAGNYTLVASNAAGMTTSAVAVLTVYREPALIAALRDQVVEIGDTVVLSGEATGTEPLTLAWQFNGSPLAETNATLVLTNIQLNQTGFYHVTASNPHGSASSTGRVSVVQQPSALLAWGDDTSGQSDAPAGLRDIVAAAGGDFHSIALRRNGTLVGWGYDGEGQASVPTSTLRFVDIAAGGSHNLALTERGGVVAWGHNDSGQADVPAAATHDILAIAAGEAHGIALRSDGTLLSWGDNSHGQTALPQGLNGVQAIAAGRKHNLVLLANGTVSGWGYNAFGQTVPPTALTDAAAIAAGYLHSVALRSDGTVVCWGDNTYGQTDVPPGLTNVTAIAAGDLHTYARLANGNIVAWGDGVYGQLDIPMEATNIIALASGYYHGLTLVPSGPRLRLARLPGGGMVVEWEGGGVLQWAQSLPGPFQDMPEVSGSYTNRDFTSPSKFFRLRQ